MIKALIPRYIENHRDEFAHPQRAIYARDALYNAIALAIISSLAVALASTALSIAMVTMTVSIVVLSESTKPPQQPKEAKE